MIEIILTSSVLILLLVVLRQTLRGRISPRIQYALWLLAAARLLIPGTLFHAPVSVLGAAEGLQTSLHETFPEPDHLPEPASGETTVLLPQQSPQPAMPPVTTYPETDNAASNPPAAPEEEITQRVWNWPELIWKTGIAVTGGALVLSNLTFYLRMQKKRKRLAMPDASWSGKLPVYVVEGLPSPCLFGVFRPAIYLNEAAMDAAHPEHILAHEYTHYRHGDHVWAVLRSVCLAVHWYNPLVWWAAALSRRDCELACDEAAIRRLGEDARIDYGQTLLGMVSRSRSSAALLCTATTMTAGKRAMKERITLIVKQPRMRKVTLVLVTALACLLAACAFGGKSETQTPEGTPASVYLGEVLSSQARPGPITDPETVSRLWELYQGFVFDGTTEELTRDNVWSVTVTFQDETGNDMAHFTIFEGGLCWLEDDYETIHVLRDGQSIYEEFRDCCRNTPRDVNYIPVETDEAAVLDEVLARFQENAGGTIGVSYTGKSGAPANGTLTESETAALDEAFRACQWTRTEDPGDDLVYWHSTSVAGFTFYDGSPLVSYTHSRDGGVDWYYAPEGWVTVEAALFYDTDTAHTLEEKKGLFLYEQARAEWNAFQSGLLPERYDGMFETEEGTWLSVGFFESLEDYRGYLETMFSPEIAENLLNMYTFQDYNGRLHILQHGEGASNIYAGDEIVTVFALSSEEAVQYGYDGHIFAQTPVLGEDLETVLGYKRHDYYYSWNGTHYAFTNFGPSDDVDPQIYDNAEEIIAQIQRRADTSEWLPLLNYMDWSAIARAAVNAGMDDGDGTLAVTNIIGDLTRYAERYGDSDMPLAEYLYILSATEGLDGAPAEGYAGLLYRMYVLHPSQFAYVVLEQLPEAQRNEVLDLFRGEWMFHREPYQDTAPSREEAVAQLEADMTLDISVLPSGRFTFYNPGDTLQCRLENASGIYAVTWASSDPGVAEVNENGIVTSVSPGEATISIHYEGPGGPKDFSCMVQCDW